MFAGEARAEGGRGVGLVDGAWAVDGETGVQVCAAYCDLDTGRSIWVAIRAPESEGTSGEKLVPIRFLVRLPGGGLAVTLPTAVIRQSPTLHGAPTEICDCTEDPLIRHYADAVNPVPDRVAWPMPRTCSARRCYRTEDPAELLLAVQLAAVAHQPGWVTGPLSSTGPLIPSRWRRSREPLSTR